MEAKEMNIEELTARLKEAEETLRKVVTLQVSYDNPNISAPNLTDVLLWRVEMASEYCEKYGLLK